MTQALTPPTFSGEATALAENPTDSATNIATEPPSIPDSTPRPVTQRERIPTIDVVRGVALVGILLMNIASFSGPWDMYINPLMVGNHRTANLVAWTLRWQDARGLLRALRSRRHSSYRTC